MYSKYKHILENARPLTALKFNCDPRNSYLLSAVILKRVLIETKMRDWQERAIEKLRVLAEKIQEKPLQNLYHDRPSSQEMSDSDLFDDEDSNQEEPREEQPLSEFDREIQIYKNFSKEKYVEWRDRQSKPRHNVESSYYRRFWDDHNLLMPTLSKIALKVRNFIYLKIKTSLRSPDCRLHQMRLKENLAKRCETIS